MFQITRYNLRQGFFFKIYVNWAAMCIQLICRIIKQNGMASVLHESDE